MKKSLAVLVGLFLIFALAGVSMAIPYEVKLDDNVSFSKDYKTNTWTFSNIPGVVNSANLCIKVIDTDWQPEFANMFADGRKIWNSEDLTDTTYGPISVFAEVKNNNELIVKIDLLRAPIFGYGDFIVDYVKLNVDYTPASVPEPATMLLLGLGLVGLAGFGRKKFNS